MNTKFDTGSRDFVVALAYNDLVYVRNWKCASFFFYNNFLRLGWKPILWSSIDWQRQQVFGHVINPIVLRTRGLAQMLEDKGLLDYYISNPEFQDMLRFIPTSSAMNMGPTLMYGSKAYEIDWIPLVQSHKDNIVATQQMLAHYKYNISYDDWDFAIEHLGEAKKKQAERIIRRQFVETMVAERPNFIQQQFVWEYVLDGVWENFYDDVRDPSWPACQQRSDFKNLPSAIKQELMEHHNNPMIRIVDDSVNIDLVGTDQAFMSRVMLLSLADDCELYADIINRFDPHGTDWPSTSWLPKKH